MSDNIDPVSSIRLWAAAKFIGRECATEGKEFCICKKEKGENPNECVNLGDSYRKCANKVVADLETRFPQQYEQMVKCIDKNDFRFADCRNEEKALIDSWNAALSQN